MKQISIQKYKSIKDIKINNLNRVNVFTGKNNTGKSSILEAISLFVMEGNIRWIEYLIKLILTYKFIGVHITLKFVEFTLIYYLFLTNFSVIFGP